MNGGHVDVIVVGAGISGIDAAYHLTESCPDRSFTILEARDDIGGTWDLFRYPGVRSDSDMHTLGFGFKPWIHDKAIADGPSILSYLREAVAEHDIERHIRFGHRVERAEWSSDDSRWTLHVRHAGDLVTMTCGFLFMCSGYYSYAGGYRPEFPGEADFLGPIVHPQDWPEDLDYRGKKVVVIGSGATAMTLVPAMAADAAHVTMVQRSPTYVVVRPDVDRINLWLRRILPDRIAYSATRFKNLALGQFFYRRTRTAPDKMRKLLLDGVRKELGDDSDIDIERHFTPTYDPWDQRVCLLPNGDLFQSLKDGRASVVTGHISRFTGTGLELESGESIEADIIVTATGLNLLTLGGMEVAVDGADVDFSETWTYKGLGYSDVPNLVSTFGYINASWTVRADITCDYVCRLLNHMRDIGATQATPRLRPSDRGMPERPFIDDFSAGYMQRMMPALPRQSDREPWTNPQTYAGDRKQIVKAPIEDGVMTFTTARTHAPA